MNYISLVQSKINNLGWSSLLCHICLCSTFRKTFCFKRSFQNK